MRNRRTGKVITLLLASAMAFTAVPVSAETVSENDGVPVIEEIIVLEAENAVSSVEEEVTTPETDYIITTEASSEEVQMDDEMTAETVTSGTTEDGLEYEVVEAEDGSQSITITKYSGNATEVTVPSSIEGIPVTSIGEKAFWWHSELTSVTIPSSVTNIGERAFSGCSNLTSIIIPNSVTSIGICAFSDCSSLSNITIPKSVTTIGRYAFSDCSSLTNILIPSSVTNIEYGTFLRCTGLTNVTMQEGIKSIDNCILEGCSGIERVTIPSSVTNIGISAFSGCDKLTNITIAEGNAIYDSRENCNAIIEKRTNTLIFGISTTKIPDGVTIIGNNAFSGCKGLTSITIPKSVTKIKNNAFSGCNGLTSVTIQEGVEDIGDKAFLGCIKIEGITIPSSVTSIGCQAFLGCVGLTSVTMQEGVESIGDNAFLGCIRIESITIPSSVESIGYRAFLGCTELASITIPSSVKSIGKEAFSGCSGLKNVTMQDGVSDIGECAFKGCAEIESIIIPSSVTSIGYQAFLECIGLTSVTIQEGVKGIEGYAFEGCTGIESITIPSSMINITYDSFKGCEGLANIAVAEDNTVYDSRGNCNAIIEKKTNTLIFGISNTKIPEGVTAIGDWAFSYCSKMKNISIPQSVKSIGEYAFLECTGLESITILSGSLKIEYGSFAGCKGLESITIPSGVKSIGNDAFEDCSGLASLILREGVTSVGAGTFSGCAGLENVEIPKSVTSLGDAAFYYCDKIKDIYYTGGKEEWSTLINKGQDYYFSYRKTFTIHYNTTMKSAKVVDMIKEIGEVTLDKKEVIEDARTAYDTLEEYDKQYVTQADIKLLTEAETKYAQLIVEKAEETVKLIKVIGVVTLDSKEAIDEARTSYDALSDEAKQLISVEDLKLLTDAEAEYEQLMIEKEASDKKKAAETVELIKTIGTVITLDSKESIEKARAAYDALSDDAKQYVSAEDLRLLTNAEAKYAQLKAAKDASDKESAADVVEMIKSIGTVTLEKKEVIDNARTAYDALTDDEKQYVTEEDLILLTDAEAKYLELIVAKEDVDKKNAADAVEMIKAIGTVTLDSKAAIDKARASYDALSDDAKQYISAYDLNLLTSAEAMYAHLKNEKETADRNSAENTRVLIHNILEVTLSKKEAIEEARASYDALSDEAKQRISAEDLKILTDAEAKYVQLIAEKELADEAAADKKAAEDVVKLIKAIGPIAISRKEFIDKARVAYDALTEESKQYVSPEDLKLLTDAEAEYARIEAEEEAKEAAKEALKKQAIGAENVIGDATYRVVGSRTVIYKACEKEDATSVKIPETIKINDKEFTVTEIAPYAFKDNKKLTKITISKNIKVIGKGAFQNCSALKTVKIGSNVTTIGDSAFQGCGKLTKVTIPAKVTKIGKNAFYNCKQLKTVTIKTNSLKTIGKSAFKKIAKKATIKVPKKKYDAYKKLLKGKTTSDIKIKK